MQLCHKPPIIQPLDTSCSWLEFRRLDKSCGWFYPAVGWSSCGWIRVGADSIKTYLNSVEIVLLKIVFCILQNSKLLKKNYTFEFSLVSRLSLDKLFWIWFVILAIIYINSVYLLSKYYNIYSILQKLTSTEKSTILY